MSAIQANNENKTVFNIIMENGLPYKPFIIAETSLFTMFWIAYVFNNNLYMLKRKNCV